MMLTNPAYVVGDRLATTDGYKLGAVYRAGVSRPRAFTYALKAPELYRGVFELAGTLKDSSNLPESPKRMMVIDRLNMEVVRVGLSNADGTFSFDDLPNDRQFLVVALDDDPITRNAVRFDGVTPE